MSPADPVQFSRHESRRHTSARTAPRRPSRRLLAAGIAAASALTLATGVPGAEARSVTPSVALQMLPTQRVSPGGVAQYPFVLRTAGNTGVVSFEAIGLPGGATAEVVNLGSGRYELDVRIASNAPASNSTITLRARSRARVQSTNVYLQVLAAPQVQPPATPATVPLPEVKPATPVTVAPTAAPVFGLRSDNPERVVTAGQTGLFGVTVDRSSGYGGAVSFSVSGVPTGVAANFAPNPTSTNTVLYLTPSASVPNGRYAIAISGTAGTTVRVVSAVMVVQNQADFALDVPATAPAAAGSVSNIVIGYRSLSTTSSPTVTLAVSGLPTGASASFSPNPTFGPTTLVVSLAAGTAVGSYPLTITGTAGTITHTYPLSLVVAGAGGFGLSASPAALSVARSTSGNVVLTVVPSGGFTGAITVSLSGLPAGASVAQTPGPNQVTLTLVIPAGTTAGIYPVTITGISGSLSAAVSVTLTVT